MTDYRHTFNGMVGRMFYYMQRRVDGGGLHPNIYEGLSIMTRRQFNNLIRGNRQLRRLYYQWRDNDFALKYRPTPNRIDHSKGYIPKNLEFVTYSRNSKLGSKRRHKIS